MTAIFQMCFKKKTNLNEQIEKLQETEKELREKIKLRENQIGEYRKQLQQNYPKDINKLKNHQLKIKQEINRLTMLLDKVQTVIFDLECAKTHKQLHKNAKHKNGAIPKRQETSVNMFVNSLPEMISEEEKEELERELEMLSSIKVALEENGETTV